jgi:predicted CopG family antitoxin
MNEEVKTIQLDEEAYQRLVEIAEQEQISPEEAAQKIILTNIKKK